MPKAASYAKWFLESYCLGLKLRSLRSSKRLTLARLSAETGLSTALLSKLETDRMTPTLPTLATLARVYGVGMSYFFKEPSRHKLSITRKTHLQGNGRGMEPMKMTPLYSDAEGFRMVAQVIEFPPGGSTLAVNTFQETGAVLYVLEGRLRLDAGGVEEVLETGDCACMESEMPMAWSAADRHCCKVLAILPRTAPAASNPD